MNMNSPGALRIMYNSIMLESIKVSEGQKIVLNVGKDVSEVNLSLVHHSSVEEVLVSSENPNYSSFGGLLYSKDCKTLIACPGGFEKTSLEFNKYNDPQRVGSSTALLAAQLQTIKRDAFRNCSGIRGIVLPDRLQTVERNAFSGCTALRAVTLPSSLESISYDAFENCNQLQYLSFEGSRTEFLSLHIELPDTLRYSFTLEGDIQGEELEKIVSFFEDAEEAPPFSPDSIWWPAIRESSWMDATGRRINGSTAKRSLRSISEHFLMPILAQGFLPLLTNISGKLTENSMPDPNTQ